MHESHFAVDTEGRTCLVVFGKVVLVPESFASYTLSLRDPFTVPVAQHLGWPSSSNLDTMSNDPWYVKLYLTQGFDQRFS